MRVGQVVAAAVVVLALSGCAGTQFVQPTPEPTVAPTPSVTPEPVVTTGPTIVDSGVRDGATGTIELNVNGTPWKYTVAEGDYPDAICYRFNLAREQLVDENGDTPDRIYPGDVIRFVEYEGPTDR